MSSAYNKTSDILLTGRLSAVWEIRGWVSKTQRQNINSSRLSSDGLKHPLRSLSRAIQTTKARPVVLVIPLLKPLPHITRQWLQCTCYTLILIIYIVLWLRLSISEIAHWRVLWFGRSSWALVLYGTNYSNKKKVEKIEAVQRCFATQFDLRRQTSLNISSNCGCYTALILYLLFHSSCARQYFWTMQNCSWWIRFTT